MAPQNSRRLGRGEGAHSCHTPALPNPKFRGGLKKKSPEEMLGEWGGWSPDPQNPTNKPQNGGENPHWGGEGRNLLETNGLLQGTEQRKLGGVGWTEGGGLLAGGLHRGVRRSVQPTRGAVKCSEASQATPYTSCPASSGHGPVAKGGGAKGRHLGPQPRSVPVGSAQFWSVQAAPGVAPVSRWGRARRWRRGARGAHGGHTGVAAGGGRKGVKLTCRELVTWNQGDWGYWVAEGLGRECEG